MSKFYTLFPKIKYNHDGNSYNNTTVMTNVLFRIKILQKIKNNIYTYYDVDISDTDTIEIIADNYYGDPEYHWVIALANDIVDVHYDWPMNSRVFTNYIKSKYGSVANAKTQNHHYEKTIKRVTINGTYEDTIEIDSDTYASLAGSSFESFTLSDGTTVDETITKKAVSCYEFERDANEKKRRIKIIKKEYLPQILGEFRKLMELENPNLRIGMKRIG